MKRILLSLLSFVSLCANSQNWKSHPKKPYSSTDSCLVFQDSTKKFYRIKCSEINTGGSSAIDTTKVGRIEQGRGTAPIFMYFNGVAWVRNDTSYVSQTGTNKFSGDFLSNQSFFTFGLNSTNNNIIYSDQNYGRMISENSSSGIQSSVGAFSSSDGSIQLVVTNPTPAYSRQFVINGSSSATPNLAYMFDKGIAYYNGDYSAEMEASQNLIPSLKKVKQLISDSIGTVQSTTLPDGKIWIGDGTDTAFPRTLSGDVTVSNLGVTSYNNVVPVNKGGFGAINGIGIGDGSGNVSLATPNIDYQYASYYDVRRYGAVGDGVTNNTTAFNNCLAAMSAGETMYIPEGYWVGDIVLSKGINILGAGTPQLDTITTTLKGGSVIIGYINLNAQINSSAQNLGIDQTTTTNVDGITCGSPVTRTLNHVIKNITVLGRGYTGVAPFTSAHGVHCETGKGARIENVKAYKYAHGTSIKVSNSNVSNCYYEDCVFDAFIVKSDNTHLLVENININNVVAVSKSASCQSAFYVQGYNSGSVTRNVNINNFVSDGSTGRGVYVECVAGSTVDYVNFNNSIVSDVANSAYEVVGLADYVTFNSCQAINAGDYSFENGTGTNIQLIGYRSVAPTTGDISGTFTQNEVNASSTRGSSFERTSTSTNSTVYPMTVRAKSSGNMVDGFGIGVGYQVNDVDNITYNLGLFQFRRSGADNTSYFQLNTYNAGSTSSGILIGPNSNTNIGGGVFAQSKLDVSGNVSIGATYAGTTAAPTNGAIIQGDVGIGTSSPTSRLNVSGSFALAYVAKTGTYTATANDYLVDCTSGTFTVTLPTAVGITGRIYEIVNSGAGTITIATTSSQTFTNVTATPTTLSLITAQGKSIKVMSNGANWIQLN